MNESVEPSGGLSGIVLVARSTLKRPPTLVKQLPLIMTLPQASLGNHMLHLNVCLLNANTAQLGDARNFNYQFVPYARSTAISGATDSFASSSFLSAPSNQSKQRTANIVTGAPREEGADVHEKLAFQCPPKRHHNQTG